MSPVPARFDGLAVAVIGGGQGLGRRYALDLGARGAKVLVVSRSASAQAVAAEIVAAGGAAAPCIADARDGEAIVAAVLAAFGKIDALLANAGITRDRGFGKMTVEDWDEVTSIHLDGAFACARAAWQPMIDGGGGAMLFTTSGAGMHGNFGQANYAAAKAGIMGLAKSLAREGARHNIRVNAIAPMALTAMTEGVFTPELKAALSTDDVSPVALALLHPSSTATGQVIETGGGWASAMRWERSEGVRFDGISVENVLAAWDQIIDFSAGTTLPDSIADSLGGAMAPTKRQRGAE